jgi:hypothetical protein
MHTGIPESNMAYMTAALHFYVQGIFFAEIVYHLRTLHIVDIKNTSIIILWRLLFT